jgi:Na+-transporting NADH:ubiquinone oxidoreductase subunit C
MKKFSNTYIFLYVGAIVMVTAALLSFIAENLRPYQQRNVEIEQMEDILRSVGRAEEAGAQADKNQFIIDEFNTYINESIVLNHEGNVIEGRDAFEIAKNMKLELAKPLNERGLPMFFYSANEGNVKYIIPLLGRGLWGPIWGYIALDSDFSTIYGAVFDHAKETPGLGAEINTDWFQERFEGKELFNPSGEFVSIQVVKRATEGDHEVNGISGGTITSKGVEEMIYAGLKPYEAYFKKQLKSDNNE